MVQSGKQPYSIAVGRRLTEIREARGLTKSELARRSGFSYKHIQQVESGQRNPSVNFIAKIAFGLDVEPKELMPDLPRT